MCFEKFLCLFESGMIISDTVKREMFADDLFGKFCDRGKSTKINRPKFSLVLVYTQIQELSLKKTGKINKL